MIKVWGRVSILQVTGIGMGSGLWMDCDPQHLRKGYAEVLNPSSSECDLFGKQRFLLR